MRVPDPKTGELTPNNALQPARLRRAAERERWADKALMNRKEL
jgi:hypothetical protein